MDQLSSRINAFKSRMLALAGKQGYDSLETGSNLGTPLVSNRLSHDGEEGHPLGRDSYAPPTGTYAGQQQGVTGNIVNTVPNQSMELIELTHLAKEAAAILWEMVALGEKGAAMDEMMERAQQLQGQLRGLIGDVTDAEESVLADAFQAFDMLSRCLSDQSEDVPEAAAAAAAAAPSTSPVVAAPTPEAERPLIDL